VGTNQIHDYNPGIASNGLFWTMPIADDAIDVSPGKGRASLVAEDVAVPDFFDFVQSLFPAASVPATVSFDARWFDVQSRVNRNEPDFGFAGEFVTTSASIEWSAEQAGFRFQSDPHDASTTVVAIVGNERNGVFFD
jgi:hypothetical protein